MKAARRPRILFVGSASSVHTARWLRQLEEAPWDLHLFDPSNALIHRWLTRVTVHTGWRKQGVPRGVTVRSGWPFLRGRRFMARRLPWIWRHVIPESGGKLARLITRLQPDCLHSLGMQLYSYTTLEALGALGPGDRPPWIYSCRGHDIYYYRRDPQDLVKIREVLASCGYLFANCRRDRNLAREHGFEGRFLGYFQGGGGYPVDEMQKLRSPGGVSERRVVAVKGLQHGFGRALVALEALEHCAEDLRGFKIALYQAHPEVRARAAKLAAEGLDVEVVPRVDPDAIWRLFGTARVSLAVHVSDGIPNAMIESMIMGALPIQTNPGGATAEWIEDGVNGLLIRPDSGEAIAEALRHALRDDALVETAAQRNLALAAERVEGGTVRDRVLRIYREVMGLDSHG